MQYYNHIVQLQNILSPEINLKKKTINIIYASLNSDLISMILGQLCSTKLQSYTFS